MVSGAGAGEMRALSAKLARIDCMIAWRASLFAEFIIRLCTLPYGRVSAFAPLPAKRLVFNRAQIARSSPGRQRWRHPRNEATDFTDPVSANNESLKQVPKLSAQFVPTRSDHNRRPQLERKSFCSAAARLLRTAFCLLRFGYLRAQMQQQLRNVDLDRTHFTTGTAQARRVRQLRRFAQSNQLRRDDGADWSRVNRAVGMPANLLIDRTRVQAGAAANARERLPRSRMGQHSRAAIVEQDDMQLIRPFSVRAALRPRNQ